MPQTKKRLSVTAAEAAQEIGVSEKTIHRMLERKELEGFRVTLRRGYRVYKDSIDKLLRDREFLSKPKSK